MRRIFSLPVSFMGRRGSLYTIPGNLVDSHTPFSATEPTGKPFPEAPWRVASRDRAHGIHFQVPKPAFFH
jgi:hypothetical protein